LAKGGAVVVPHQLGALIMKTLLGIAAVLAVVGVATVDTAEARGPRGAGNVSTGNIQAGPRVTAPVIRPDRLGPQVRPRVINGPREGGRGINCGPSGTTQQVIINPRTGRSETVTIATGPIRCSTRY
jgi:hypothetical protein